jgi:excisionase family DNA binding protein
MQEPSDSASTSMLLTIPQVATYLSVCRAHVYKLIRDGLPTIHLGRLVRIHKETLDAWLKDREQDTHFL